MRACGGGARFGQGEFTFENIKTEPQTSLKVTQFSSMCANSDKADMEKSGRDKEPESNHHAKFATQQGHAGVSGDSNVESTDRLQRPGWRDPQTVAERKSNTSSIRNGLHSSLRGRLSGQTVLPKRVSRLLIQTDHSLILSSQTKSCPLERDGHRP